MAIDIQYRNIKKTALPRTGKILDAVGGSVAGMSVGSNIGGSSFAGYWDLVTTNADGEELEEGKEYIRTSHTAVSEGDMIAFAESEDGIVSLPIAGNTQIGIVGIKAGGGIVVDEDGYISIDKSFGGGSGINDVVSSGAGNAVTSIDYNSSTKTLTYVKGNTFALLSQIPTTLKNPYALSWSGYDSGSYDGSTAKRLTIPSDTSQLSNGAGYITGITSSTVGAGPFVTGVSASGTYVAVSKQDTITCHTMMRVNNNGVGGLSYWRTDNNTGVKIGGGNVVTGYSGSYGMVGRLYFNWQSSTKYAVVDADTNFLACGDVVAFAAGQLSNTVPVASSSVYGLVKYDNDTIKVNASGQLYCTVSGGSGGGGTVAWGNITGKPSWIGSSKPSYSWSEITGKPSWIGSSKPSYTWGEIGSKPSGLVTSVSISGSGNAVTNASFSGGTLTLTKGTISGGSGSSWDTNRFSIHSNGGAMFKSTGSMFTPTHSDSRAAETGVEFYNNQVRGVHSGYSSNNYVNNLYLNYFISSNLGVRIDGSGVLTSYGNNTWSDMRLKDYVGDVADVLPSILKVDVFRYRMKNWTDSPIMIGVSAQAVLPLFPEVVNVDEEGFYSVDYSKLGILSFVGLRELYGKYISLDNLVRSRAHWELTKDQQIRHLQDTVIKLQKEIETLKEGRAA